MPKGIYERKTIPYWKGKKRSNKDKEQMRKSHLGKKLKEEHRKNISNSLIGNKRSVNRIVSEKTKKLLSEKSKGRKVSEETRKKIGDAQRGKKRKPLSSEQKTNLSNHFKGDKSYLWKGGITPENKKIRNSTEYKYWRKSCFERDNFTCQKTGQHGGNLVVHHINNFSEFPELRFEITNGITLSNDSHIEFHNKYGRKNNTLEQLIEFLNE